MRQPERAAQIMARKLTKIRATAREWRVDIKHVHLCLANKAIEVIMDPAFNDRTARAHVLIPGV